MNKYQDLGSIYLWEQAIWLERAFNDIARSDVDISELDQYIEDINSIKNDAQNLIEACYKYIGELCWWSHKLGRTVSLAKAIEYHCDVQIEKQTQRKSEKKQDTDSKGIGTKSCQTLQEAKTISKQSELERFLGNSRKLAELENKLRKAIKEKNEVEAQRIKKEIDKTAKETQDYIEKPYI